MCDVCGMNRTVEVACVPMVPYSVAYCADCLRNNSHPMNILIANTVCMDGLEHANGRWVEIVHDSLKHQNKTLDWFNTEVSKEINGKREQ